MKRSGSAPGKIILCGEYAVVFGFPGIAVPAPLSVSVTFEEDGGRDDIEVVWERGDGGENWDAYARRIVGLCGKNRGTLRVNNRLPLGRGMGSSTAIVVAIARCLLGEDCRETALQIEDTVNLGHSGIDFSVVWNGRQIRFAKGERVEPVALPTGLLRGAVLVDTGEPNETTPELVAWIRERTTGEGRDVPARNGEDVDRALSVIGNCADRLLSGEDLSSVIRDHHRAQVALGVVPDAVQELILSIEECGGAAKVLGAGGRSGGGGMILAFGMREIPSRYPVLAL